MKDTLGLLEGNWVKEKGYCMIRGYMCGAQFSTYTLSLNPISIDVAIANTPQQDRT